jgi:hypothetical protein
MSLPKSYAEEPRAYSQLGWTWLLNNVFENLFVPFHASAHTRPHLRHMPVSRLGDGSLLSASHYSPAPECLTWDPPITELNTEANNPKCILSEDFVDFGGLAACQRFFVL